ncbi:MAG TPA: hypothetical protein VJ692_07810 [Nitrospiraceae bacterium]|nr:hypothetical protein [Nitrospiraceae bacterium]
MPDLLAGKELDVLIGRLMGWKYPNHRHVRFEDSGSGLWLVWISDAEQPNVPEQDLGLWESYTPLLKYSTTISGAWQLVESVFFNRYIFSLSRSVSGTKWLCSFIMTESEYFAEAETAPLAICLAAIRALQSMSLFEEYIE